MANLSPIQNQQLQNLNNGKSERPSKIQLLRLADSERKIGQSTEEQVKSALKYVFVLLGLNEKDVPDDYEKTVLLNFIFNNYGVRFSCQDIKNAFEMGIAGVYPVDKELYSKRFSPLYLSRFMDAYTEYKQGMVKIYKEKSIQTEALPPSKEKTPEQMERSIHKVIENYILEHKEIPPIYDITSCFNSLVRLGKIVPTPESDEIKKQNAIASNSSEIFKRGMFLSPTEIANLKKQFNEPNNSAQEIKRHYLLDYWANLLIVAL